MQLSRKLFKQIRKLNLQPRRAILGDRGGVIDEPGRPGYVRVRYPASPENTDALAYPTTVRMNAIVPKKLNKAVLVGYDADGEVAVINSDFSGSLAAGENPIVNNPADEINSRYVDQKDITTLRSQPVGPGAPMWISVLGWPYADSAGVYHEFIGEQINLTSYIPAAVDEWCLVLVALKTDDTLEITQSTDQNIINPLDSTDIQECIDGLTAGSTPVHLYKLVNGMTNILDEHDYMDMRQFINIAGGGSSGTVTSVALTMPAEYSVAGSPITTFGTLAVTKAVQNANKGYFGPTTGADDVPAFRALVDDDIPAALTLVGGTVNNTPIGASIPNTGVFTNISATTFADLTEASTPSTPSANHQRLFAINDGLTGSGFTILAALDDGGLLLRHGYVTWAILKNVTGSTIAAHKAVYFNVASGLVNIAGLAIANSTRSVLCQAVTLESIADGAFGHVIIQGPVTGFANPPASTGVFYLSATSAGDFTSTAPTGADWAQQIGFNTSSAAGANYAYVDIHEPIPASAPVGVSDTQTLTNKTLTAPTIADFTNANHDHLDADDGGTLSAGAIASGTLSEGRLPHKFAVIEEQQAQNTAGGASTATTWTTRVLNTEVVDADSIVTLSGNQFTPIAGTYRIMVNAPFIGSATTPGSVRIRLYNVTQTSVVLVSPNHFLLTNQGVNATLFTEFTANGTDAYAVQYYVTQSRVTNGLGAVINEASAVEHYTQALLELIG